MTKYILNYEGQKEDVFKFADYRAGHEGGESVCKESETEVGTEGI